MFFHNTYYLGGVGGGVGRCEEGGARTAALSSLSRTASSTRAAKTEDVISPPSNLKNGFARHLA
jgi:hypothetical protein